MPMQRLAMGQRFAPKRKVEGRPSYNQVAGTWERGDPLTDRRMGRSGICRELPQRGHYFGVALVALFDLSPQLFDLGVEPVDLDPQPVDQFTGGGDDHRIGGTSVTECRCDPPEGGERRGGD